MNTKSIPIPTPCLYPCKESPPEVASTATARKPLKTLALALSCLALTGGSAHAGLIHRYTFNDNVNDSGIGGINGTPTGSTTNLEPPSFVADIPAGTVAGAPTKSMQVGVSYPTKKSGFTLGTQVFTAAQGSMSFWAKANSLANGNYLFTTSTDNDLFMLATGATVLRTRAGASSLIEATVASGTWYHFAITWDNTAGTFRLYLNGSEVTTGADNSFTVGALSSNGFRIGSFNLTDDGNQLTSQFAGQFYDLHFYDHVLTPAEAAFLRQNPGAVIAESVTLANRYVFDDNTNDSIGGRNGTSTIDGTNTEAPVYGTVVPSGATGPTKSMEVGMNIGTKKSGFNLPVQVISDRAGAGSVSMFIRPESDAGADLRYAFGALPSAVVGANGFLIGQRDVSSNQILRGSVAGAGVGGDFTMTANNWYHVALVWKQAGADLLGIYYVNGTKIGSTTRVVGKTINNLGGVRVGGFNLADDLNNFANQLDGRIYDVQIYDGLLTDGQVAQLNASPGAVVPEAVTLAHRYMFDGNVSDAVGARDGTATTAVGNLEAPAYATVVPAGATGPAKSIEFGMNIGTKKSGFTLPPQVFSAQAAAGSVAMFIRPDSDADATNLRYALTVDPTANGLVLAQILSGSDQVLRRNVAGSASNFTITAGNWYHVVLTWKQSGPDLLVSYYVNGSEIVNSRVTGKSITATGTHRVGGFNLTDNISNFANQFDGRMYDMQVYNGVLTPAQVSQLNAAPGAVIPEVTPPFVEFDPSAPVPAGYILKKEWHWATDGSLDGWTAENFTVNLPGDVSGSVVTGTSGASTDPQFISPDFISTAPASGGRIIEIGVITDVGGTGNSPELFWQADELGEFSADRRVQLPVLPADGAAHVFRVTFTGDIVGVLNNIRFDPSRSANIISKIDFVRIYTDGPSDFTLPGGVTPYETWAGPGVAFDDDTNGDGVKNGLAFLLGALNPNDSALSLLPMVTQKPAGLELKFNMLKPANRGTATLSVEHSRDLGSPADPWTTVLVTDINSGPTSGVTFEVGSGAGTTNPVTATIDPSEAGGTGKLFGRLKGEK